MITDGGSDTPKVVIRNPCSNPWSNLRSKAYWSCMNTATQTPDSDFPRMCIEEGLTCHSCTRETARQVAAVCKGLRGKAIGQLFVQLYPDSACSPMHFHFANCYQEASSDLLQAEESEPTTPIALVEPAFERREVLYARPRAMSAVA